MYRSFARTWAQKYSKHLIGIVAWPGIAYMHEYE